MSSRKNRSPEEQARRAKIRELLQESNISSMEDIQNLFKETIAEFMENGLDAELDDELGYSKYDYKNKETENSRNGHSSKTLRTSFGDVEVAVPRDRKGEFDPHKKHGYRFLDDVENRIALLERERDKAHDDRTHHDDIVGGAESVALARNFDRFVNFMPEHAADYTFLRNSTTTPAIWTGSDATSSAVKVRGGYEEFRGTRVISPCSPSLICLSVAS